MVLVIGMNWQKVDASLASALADVQDPDAAEFDVFIHTANNPGPTESTYLQGLGAGNIASGRQIITAKLSARAISGLSDQSWVRSLRLSRRLKLLEKA